MRLFTGPPGSGKTAVILNELRVALRAGEAGSVRLLVPTATLAQHMQNELAREGLVFPPSIVQTLKQFIADWCREAPEVSETVFYWIVEAAVRRLNRTEFAAVMEFPGFSASLARAIAEFAAAGCDSARLAARLPDAPLADAFLAVYQEVDRELARRGLALRARRLEIAAARIAASGPGAVRRVWFDGFHALPEPELHLIAALAKHARVTITLSDFAAEGTRENLERIGFLNEQLPSRRIRAATVLVKAANIEREAEEIARRILAQAADGRAFREMGVIVRAAETYAPVLRSTFARFGIPARFYFDAKLDEHAAIRFLSGALDALLAGWDHAATLAAMRLAPRFADLNAMDRFDFAVREQVPNTGLEALQILAADAEPMQRLIASFASLDEWRSLSLIPREWASRFQTLRNLFRPAQPVDTANHELALLYRSQAAALDLFDAAVTESASILDAQTALSLAEFWRMVKSALRLTPLRVRDGRRNTVQVLSAHEARQWSLPVVFVCGLTERQFPQFHHQDPFFPEHARLRLIAAGIRVRSAAGFESEERALFDAAITRGSSLVTMTYPEYDVRGERTLPSIFLDDLHAPLEESRAARPRPRAQWMPRARTAIAAPALLDYLRERTGRVTPSGLESYLQCAFQFFGSRTLRLKTAPKRPEQRLNENYLLQGEIVHNVLAAAYAEPDRIEQVFEEEFERVRAEQGIPKGYHTERLRNAMREDLLAFAADAKWPRAQFQSRTEEKFVFALDPSLDVSGRIDRLDVGADGKSYVIDYKYSAAQRTKSRLKDGNLLQAPLYYMAAKQHFGVEPDGVFYVGLKSLDPKKGVDYVGWSHSGFSESNVIPEDWLEKARARTLQAALEIRAGRVEVAPANPASCRFCDCRDVCRVTTRITTRVTTSATTDSVGTEGL
jgi:ATP-dependent helicase/DNAse subunit B